MHELFYVKFIFLEEENYDVFVRTVLLLNLRVLDINLTSSLYVYGP